METYQITYHIDLFGALFIALDDVICDPASTTTSSTSTTLCVAVCLPRSLRGEYKVHRRAAPMRLSWSRWQDAN